MVCFLGKLQIYNQKEARYMDDTKKQRMQQLNHVRRDLDSGGFVLVLDTGAVLGPEAVAMLQALYSRSPKSVFEHLEDVRKRGAEKFMQSYYVGYGHKSIGDCASVTVFIEGVSILAAKAIQDTQLYNGQEVSTRYVDFATQSFIDPVGTDESKQIHEELRQFYIDSRPILVGHLKKKYPRPEDSSEAVYEKAINARAFDVLRGFLPAGASTNLSWHTTLRHAADHLMRLRHHPMKEVQNIALQLEEALAEAFPNSFVHKKYPKTEEYVQWAMKNDYYYFSHLNAKQENSLVAKYSFSFDETALQEYRTIFERRPEKTEMPKWIADAGEAKFEFFLDFGSYRDLQRHRAVNQRMPILTTKYGFGDWYLDEMPAELAHEAELFLNKIKSQISALYVDKVTAQYYIPMGYLVAHQICGDLSALVYLLERRAGSTVHPTLQRLARKIANRLGSYLQDKFDLSLPMRSIDEEEIIFDIRRGHEDIVRKS